MAGRKQHFIPKHFLKGFVDPDGADKLWMCRRGLPEPVQVSRDDVAAIRDFYSKPSVEGQETLDDLITTYENDLAVLVDEIRNVPVGEALPSEGISEVVAHLTVRTAHMRNFIEEGISSIVSSADDIPSQLFVRENFPKHMVPNSFMTAALKQLESVPLQLLTPITSRTIVRMTYHRIRENFEEFQEEALTVCGMLLREIQDGVCGLGETTHKRVLVEELVPNIRRRALEQFHWKVVDFVTNDAVLSDCVAVAKDINGWGPYVLADQKTTTHIIIPISPSKLVVASLSDDWADVVEGYNRIAEESSFTFYLTEQKQEISQRILAKLGSSMRERLLNVASTAFSDAIDGWRSENKKRDGQVDDLITWADSIAEGPIKFSVSLRDFGDDEYAKRIGEVLGPIVERIGRVIPLHRIDGFTFSHDYKGALQAIDRGEDTNFTIDPTLGTDPNSVCAQLIVRREGGLKTHIVLRGHMAEYLLGEDKELKEEAIKAICYGLGNLAFYTLLSTKFPEKTRVRERDDFEYWLLRYNESLPAAYFSYNLVSSSSKEQDFYAELALDKLNEMVDLTSKAHAQYHLDRDHESYFETSAVCASKFMSALARYFASCDPENIQNHSEELLWKLLRKLDLAKWALLFKDDLVSFNTGLNDWVDFDQVNFLNLHLERLLFDVGVVADQLQDRKFYVHVSNEHKLSGLF